MKHFLPILTIGLATLGLSGCQTEDADPFGGLASVRIEKQGNSRADGFEVLITPSENSVSMRYALGDEADFDAFRAGKFEGEVSVKGNQPVSVPFEGLDEAVNYTVYAVAMDAAGREGEVASLKVRTISGTLLCERQYLLSESVGYKFSLSPEYRSFRYHLGTEADRDAFFGGTIADAEQVEILINYTVNYFDLKPETDYVFFAEVIDRAGNPVHQVADAFRTPAVGEAPAVTLDYTNDIYMGTYKLTPNTHCRKVSATISLKGAQDETIYHNLHWKGDVMGMLQKWEGVASANIVIAEGGTTAELELRTPTLETDNPLEIYALVYDSEGNPAGIQHFDFRTPAYDPDAPKASVRVAVSDITTKGATYTYTMDEGTFAVMYDTVDAEWWDNFKATDPNYNEYYLHNLLYSAGGKWFYKQTTGTFTEATGKPGTRYYAVGAPMNCNGPLANGWGELAIVEYTTLTE